MCEQFKYVRTFFYKIHPYSTTKNPIKKASG